MHTLATRDIPVRAAVLLGVGLPIAVAGAVLCASRLNAARYGPLVLTWGLALLLGALANLTHPRGL